MAGKPTDSVLLSFAVQCMLLCVAVTPHGAVGDIVFGQSCALTGAIADLGTEMRDGIRAAFKEINSFGGIRGQNLSLITYDDVYDPTRAYNNTKRLLEVDNVFALIGPVGTATATTVLPLVNQHSVPFIGAYTGTVDLRTPHNSLLLNIRASYVDEATAMVDYLVNKKLLTRISVFFQDDGFGLSGYNGAKAALAKMGLPIESEGRYTRSTVNVQQGLDDIVTNGRPQAILLMSVYAPAAEFIRRAKQDSRLQNADSVIFMTVSAVGSNSLRTALNGITENILIMEVVPHPFLDRDGHASYSGGAFKLVENFNAAMAAHNASLVPSHVSLEGYLAGRFVAAAIERIPTRTQLTRQSFLDAVYLSSMFIIDGQLLGPFRELSAFCPFRVCKCNQGMKELWAVKMNATTKEFILVDDAKFNFYDTCFSDPTALKSPIVFGASLPMSLPDTLATDSSTRRMWTTTMSPLNASAADDVGTQIARSAVLGIADAFASINAQGGVHGHLLHFKAIDDKGSLPSLDANIRALLIDERVFGFALPVGTTASTHTQGVITQVTSEPASVASMSRGRTMPSIFPIVAPMTAELSQRETFTKSKIFLQASHADEARAIIDYAVNTLGAQSISVLYQTSMGWQSGVADATGYIREAAVDGSSIYGAVTSALGHYGIKAERTGAFTTVNDLDDALGRILFRSSHPDAVYVIAEEDELARAISQLRAHDQTARSPILLGSYAKHTVLNNPDSIPNIDGLYVADGEFVLANYSAPASSPRSARVEAAQAYTAGFAAGKFIAATLGNIFVSEPTSDAFVESVFAGLAVSIPDVATFGRLNANPCDSSSSAASCKCNQAAGVVDIFEVVASGSRRTLASATSNFHFTTCGVRNNPFVSPYSNKCDVLDATSFTFGDDYSSAETINRAGVAYTVVIIVLVLVLAVISAVYTMTRSALKSLAKRSTIILIRRSLSNYVHLGTIVVEAFQLTSIVLAADLGWTSMKGFIHAMEYIGLEFAFSWYWYVIMVLSGLWILYAILIWTGVTEKIREWEHGHVLLLPMTHFLPLMGTLGYIPTLITLMRSFSCAYTDNGESYLEAECSISCWTSEAWSLSVLGAIFLLMFVPIAIITAFFWAEMQDKLDVKYRGGFEVMDYVAKLVMCVLRIFFVRFTTTYLSLLLAINTAMSLFVLIRRPSLVVWVDYVKAASYAVSMWAAIVGLASSLTDSDHATWPEASVFAGWAFIILFTIIFIRIKYPQIRVRPTQVVHGRDRIRKIARLFQSLKKAGSRMLSQGKSKNGLGSQVSCNSSSTAGAHSLLSEEEWTTLESGIGLWKANGQLRPSDCDMLVKFVWARDEMICVLFERSQKNLTQLLTLLQKPVLQMMADEYAASWGIRKTSSFKGPGVAGETLRLPSSSGAEKRRSLSIGSSSARVLAMVPHSPQAGADTQPVFLNGQALPMSVESDPPQTIVVEVPVLFGEFPEKAAPSEPYVQQVDVPPATDQGADNRMRTENAPK